MRNSFFATIAAAALAVAGSAQAATLNGAFNVTAVNVLNRTSAQSEATITNFTNALLAAQATSPGYKYDDFTYTGDIDFETRVGASTTIQDWLKTGKNGALSDLDAGFGGLQQSKGSIGDGTATTTFYLFVAQFAIGPSDFTVEHDDGFAIFKDATRIGGYLGPNTVRTTSVDGYPGGSPFRLLYVATNSDPSILNADIAPVPLPAALPLLAVGLAGLGVMRLRRKAA